MRRRQTHVLLLLIGCAVAVASAVATGHAQSRAAAPPAPARYGLGRPASADDIARLDIDVGPDGAGLPPGRGTAAQGALTYAARCASCHGRTGTEGPNDVLVGREPRTGFPFSREPMLQRTIGNYWPYATTVFDYVRRAMPADAPGSLRDDEVYGLVAFLLARNGLVAEDAVIDATSLPKVAMPAHERFVPDTRGQKPSRRGAR